MKYKDIEIDGRYWCKVGSKWIVVVVLASTCKSTFGGNKTKFLIAKADDSNNSIRMSLPKPRSPAALHPYDENNPVPPDFGNNKNESN